MTNDSTEDVIRLARAIISGDLDVLEVCRALYLPLQRAGLREDPDAICIFGVDSEIDDLPLGDARSRWNAEALAEKDAEAAEYRARVRDGVIDACRALEQKLTRTK